MWRKNAQPIRSECGTARGVDLNRNYPFMFRLPGDLPCPAFDDDIGGADTPNSLNYRGPEAASELEIQHLTALTGHPDRSFVARVDFHSWGRQVVYPWGFTTDPSPDRTTQGMLARLLAQQLTATDWTPYTPGAGGSALYLTTGSSSDYAYEVDGTLGASVWELRDGPANGLAFWREFFPCLTRNCFYVPDEWIDAVNRESWAAVRRLIEWSIDPDCSPASAPVYVYVADPTSNAVKIIDPALAVSEPATAILQTVPVGGAPTALALTPEGAFAYVVRADAGTVSVLSTANALEDPATAEIGTITVGERPVAIAMRPDGAFAYVANEGSGDVSVIDVATSSVVATIDVDDEPRGIAASADGAFVFVSSFAADTLSRIDTASNTVTAKVELSGAGATGVTVTPDDVFVYVTAENLGSVGEPLPVGDLPGAVAGTPAANFAYVANRGSDTVSVTVIAHLGGDATTQVSVGREPVRVAFTPDEAFAWVANRADGTISIIDMNAQTVAATLPVGGNPTDVVIEWMPEGCQLLPAPPLRSTSTPTPSPTTTPTPTMTPTAEATACVGDCDDDTEVTVDEVLTLVNIALGQDEPGSCGPGDMNGDDQITVDEILAAVSRALQGCAVGD
jgi:YVTN family beta-propeller protein